MAQIPRRAVPVVGQCFDDDGDAVRAVPLVLQSLILVAGALSSGFFDDPVDVVVRDIIGLGFGDGVLELLVRGGIRAAALLDRYRDLPAHLGKDFGLLAVGFFLFALDIVPFGMSGHKQAPSSFENEAAVAAESHTYFSIA